MTEFIQKRHIEYIESYALVFDGYAFPCGANGAVYLKELSAVATENYYMCITGCGNGTVEDRSYSYTHPAIIRCTCGLEVPLTGPTNTCDCGRDYNMSGQLLAPREQWGEETGETAAEILMGGKWDE